MGAETSMLETTLAAFRDPGFWGTGLFWLFFGNALTELLSAMRSRIKGKREASIIGSMAKLSDFGNEGLAITKGIELAHPRENARAFLYASLLTLVLYLLIASLPDFYSVALAAYLRCFIVLLAIAATALAVAAIASICSSARKLKAAACASLGVVCVIALIIVDLLLLGLICSMTDRLERSFVLFGMGIMIAADAFIVSFVALLLWHRNSLRNATTILQYFDKRGLRDSDICASALGTYRSETGHGTLLKAMSFSKLESSFVVADASRHRLPSAILSSIAVVSACAAAFWFAAMLSSGPIFLKFKSDLAHSSDSAVLQEVGYDAFMRPCESVELNEAGGQTCSARAINDLLGIRKETFYDASGMPYIEYIRYEDPSVGPSSSDIRTCIGMVEDGETPCAGVIDNTGDLLRKVYVTQWGESDVVAVYYYGPGENGGMQACAYYARWGNPTLLRAWEASYNDDKSEGEWIEAPDQKKYELT